MKWNFLKISFLVLLSGCANEQSFSLIPTGQTFKQGSSSVSSKVDVLWVIDNSGSMSPSQQNLLSNFSSFMKNFISKGLDYQMAVTTTEAYKSAAFFGGDKSFSIFKDGSTFTSNGVTHDQHTGINLIYPGVSSDVTATFVINAYQGDQGAGDERAFSSMMAALANPNNPKLVRASSYLAIIILSDEDDFSSSTRIENSWAQRAPGETLAQYNARYVADHDYNYKGLDTVQSYATALDSLTGSTATIKHYNVSAVTVSDVNCLQSHSAAGSTSTIIGQRYMDLAKLTNGTIGSICDTNFASTLNIIQERILELSTEFYLDRQPNIPTIAVNVNSAIIPQDATNGWSYDSVGQGVIFHGASIPPSGANIAVNFTPATIK